MDTRPKVADHWYPKDVRSRALVDEYLEWQHINTRMGCSSFFLVKWLLPIRTGKPPNESEIAAAKRNMENVLNTFENVWLESPEKPFLASKEISFADILAACELEQPKIADYDPFKGRPRLTAWYQKVKQLTNPFYDEAHAILNKVVSSNKSKL